MRKIISTVAAFGLVLGAAATASALDLTVTGKYMLEGYYLNQAAGNGFTPGVDSDDSGSQSAWVHTFLFTPTLKVNDKVSMISEIRFLKDTDMGGTSTKMDVNERLVDIKKIYMEYMSPLGKIDLGRTESGTWASDFLNSSSSADRLMWWPSFVAEPFSLCVYTEKSVENDWYSDNDDSDSDTYKASLTYKADKILLMGAYSFINDKTHSDSAAAATNGVYAFDNLWAVVELTAPTAAVDAYDTQYSLIELYADMTFDNIYVEFEGAWATGDWKDFDAATPDQDINAWGAMLDVGMKMGNLDIGVMYYYASGDDDGAADGDIDNLMATTSNKGMGMDFNPYYILNGDHTGLLNGDEYNADADMVAAGVHCIGIHTDYKVSDQLSLHGALAYAEAADAPSGIDDEYGWEVDLGAKYKLLDNLTYEVRAAYADTGDFADDMGTAGESEDLYMLSHHLTMTF